jgi:vacuolar protein sorting-associated protein 13A/C
MAKMAKIATAFQEQGRQKKFKTYSHHSHLVLWFNNSILVISMFETTVARLLSSVLGAYVKNFSADRLSLGLFGGKITLNNLELQSALLDSLQLPFSLVAGVIGTLEISIPWTSLFNSSFAIKLKDLCLLVRPDYDVSMVRS